MPKELFPRGLLAPSMIAHILVQKYRWGLPFHRQARMSAAEGFRLDDGMMCRYAEDAGATLGCIVDAMAKEAREKAFCLSTDATGVCIQPERLPGGQRQACRKGHFFVVLADRDHVFFEFQPKHTSAAVCEMFRGFSGYIQADAHVIYDAVFRGEARASPDDQPPAGGRMLEPLQTKVVGSGRRRQGAGRARGLAPHAPPLRPRRAVGGPGARAAPCAHGSSSRAPSSTSSSRGSPRSTSASRTLAACVASAFGYAVRQEPALRRFLDDGRLPMTNNHSERALRGIASGRKVWLFFGSDDHAVAAANLLSLIASCELHRLDPETYLCDIIHVLPYWPRDRYLELAPKYWAATRARIPAAELDTDIGNITVPPPLAPSEQAATR